MPTNPNKAFANRDLPQFDMMTPGQERNIHYRMKKRSTHWTTLTILAIGRVKPIEDLTFHEASECIEKLKSWKRIENES